MSNTLTTKLVIEAAQVLKHKDAEKFAPVIRLLLATEQKQRHKPRENKPTRIEVADQFGGRARGGAVGYVNQQLIAAALRESEKPMSAEDEQALARASKKAKGLFRKGEGH